MIPDTASYTLPAAFEAERLAVFARAWLPMAVAAQLDRPGQYVAGAPGGWPLLLTRGTDGQVRAFRNRCRHRELLLAEQDSGACTSLRCRHHGWTYDLAGDLIDAPQAVAPAPDWRAYRLEAAAIQQWREVFLVNLQPNASRAPVDALERTISASAAACRHYAGARLVDIGCNWKSVLEAALADDTNAWLWPTLLLSVNGTLLQIDQVVARSALRTRIIRHVYFPDAGEDTRAQPSWAALDRLKIQAAHVQSQRAMGKAGDASGQRVAHFHEQLAAALACPVSGT